MNELVLGDPLEVAQGLVEVERDAKPRRQVTDLLGRVWRHEQIGLEDLDPREPSLGARVQLLLKRAAQADRRK